MERDRGKLPGKPHPYWFSGLFAILGTVRALLRGGRK